MVGMGQETSIRAAEIIRRIADDIEQEAERLGRTVLQKDIARALGISDTLLAHVRRAKRKGVSQETIARVASSTGIPLEVFIDAALPVDIYRRHIGVTRTRVRLPKHRPALEAGSPDDTESENNSPTIASFGLESLAGMEQQIEGVVEHLGLDMRGRHYVISALRVEAMEGRLADRWAALARAAHHARQYEAASGDGPAGGPSEGSRVVRMTRAK